VTNDLRLFVYGLLLEGEREHGLLDGADFVAKIRTEPTHTLVDLGVYPALLGRGTVAVSGELYLVSRKHRFAIDVKKECPVLFHRIEVRLEDGTLAEAYAMRDEQVRGKRRLWQGDWRQRFAPRPRAEATQPSSPFLRGSRGRTTSR
jgi:gamma-glutamylaminecyclotransferase